MPLFWWNTSVSSFLRTSVWNKNVVSPCMSENVFILHSKLTDGWMVWWLIFIRQPDWATMCPDIWSNIVLGVSVRVFPDHIDIGVGTLRRADCPLSVHRFHLVSYRPDRVKWLIQRTPPAWLLSWGTGHFQTSDWVWEIGSSGSLACQLQILGLRSLHNCVR